MDEWTGGKNVQEPVRDRKPVGQLSARHYSDRTIVPTYVRRDTSPATRRVGDADARRRFPPPPPPPQNACTYTKTSSPTVARKAALPFGGTSSERTGIGKGSSVDVRSPRARGGDQTFRPSQSHCVLDFERPAGRTGCGILSLSFADRRAREEHAAGGSKWKSRIVQSGSWFYEGC